jgi:two-component system cell cycle response regulator
MTGVILVVDDVPANVKLLEAKLTNEYYDVITAKDGYEALKQAKDHKPDLVLLDVMMPGMDGFETCSRLKSDPELAHIPVVMVTALSEPSDRVQGLEAGADDFITKPINDTALFARVKSLIRIKVLIDELRLRDQSGSQMGVMNNLVTVNFDPSGSHVWIIDDDVVQCRYMKEKLEEFYKVTVFENHHLALERAKIDEVDVVIISSMLGEIDGLRLAAQLKTVERMRHVPVVVLVDEQDTHLMLKALELGVNDYLIVPVDFNEMLARVKTQIRRKKYQDALKSNYQESVSMAITDGLTGLYNRHYLDTHLKNLVESSLEKGKSMSMVIMDMDHFKSVNDNFGHDVGDEVLKQLSQIIINATRSSDLAARYGGEEFVVLMPETPFKNAYDVAERIRRTVENNPFKITHAQGLLSKTISIGVSSLNPSSDTPEHMLKRADNALYEAKHGGRNRVCPSSLEIGVQETLQKDTIAPAGHAVSAAPVRAAAPAPVHSYAAAPQVASQAAPAMAQQPELQTYYSPPPPEPQAVEYPAEDFSPDRPAEREAAAEITKQYNYDPNLHEKAATVTVAGQGANKLQLTEAQKGALYDVKKTHKVPERDLDSPIDDEPPGTF